MSVFVTHAANDGASRVHVQVLPGQLFASATPSLVRMVLGSCVAVCLWDARRRFGGANHCLLPSSAEAGAVSGKCADHACERLLDRMLALGASRADLRAKVFGGASLFATSAGRPSLGSRNVAVARTFLAAHQIPVVTSETGGENGRKIVFLTDTGSVSSSAIVRARHGP